MWRNPADARFCALTWLTAWLALAQHPKGVDGTLLGPLFGKLTKKGSSPAQAKNQTILPALTKDLMVKVGGSTSPSVPVWQTEDGERVNLNETQVEAIGKAVISRALTLAKERMCQEQCDHDKCAELKEAMRRLEACSYHSLRVGFAVWGARAGGERAYVQTKLGGRWERLSEVFDVYWGHGESRRNRLRGVRDPLLDKLPWPLQGFTFRSTEAPSLWQMRQTAVAAGRAQGQRVGARKSGGRGGRREGVRGRPRPHVGAP